MRFICLCTNGFMAFFLNSQLGPGKGWGGEEESLIPVPALPICREPARGGGMRGRCLPHCLLLRLSPSCPLLPARLCLSPLPPPDSSASCTAAPAACPRYLCPSPPPVPAACPHAGHSRHRATGHGKVTGQGRAGHKMTCAEEHLSGDL